MFKSPVLRIYQTSRHLLNIVPPATTTASRSLIANKGIELLTAGTPNGHKASILLEELEAAYGKNYTFQAINIRENIQKQPWFTKLNPNGRIPVIVDHDRNDFAVFESLAILSYLTRHYDPDYKFHFEDPDDASRAEQFMAWGHGGLGPMQGQANHFLRIAKERIPYAMQRYVGETERLMGILDTQLDGREYLVGPGKGQYSIADIANFGWANMGYFAGIKVREFRNLWAWLERIGARPAVQKGTAVPAEGRVTNPMYEKRLAGEEGFKEKEADLMGLADKAKEQYGYKYASP